jgi:hypothetical protein
LEKAAKIICTMKLGLCPLLEENFSGCPSVCHEDVLPWQCWVSYLLETAADFSEKELSQTVKIR